MKKYEVVLLNGSLEIDKVFHTDSPKTALSKWLEFGSQRPTMAAISCGSVKDCMALYKTFVKNSEEFYQKYWFTHKACYRYEYILDKCMQYLTGNTLYFSGKPEYYDVVPLFSCG